MVKATDFKFQGQSGHDPLKILRKGGVCKNSLGGDMHSHERLLVTIIIIIIIVIIITLCMLELLCNKCVGTLAGSSLCTH